MSRAAFEAYQDAADEVRIEARWQFETAERDKRLADPPMVSRQNVVDRLLMLETILRDRAWAAYESPVSNHSFGLEPIDPGPSERRSK